MDATFTTNDTFGFAVTPQQFWGVLCRTDEWTSWWSWLERCDLDSLDEGQRAKVRIEAPLGYHIDVEVEVLEVSPASHLVAHVTGDLVGPARLDLTPTPTGSKARVSWELTVQGVLMSRAAAIGRPIVQASHEHVMELGRGEFDDALEAHGLPTEVDLPA